jgi:murein DD-endopeptidase MepM/ murein hydrolase activator NlpD
MEMMSPVFFRAGTRRLAGGLAALLMAVALAARGGEQTYVVKRNDTLYGVARRNGISVSHLADRNGLPSNARLFVGQHLVIPTKSGATADAPPALDDATRKAIATARVAPGRWRYIVVHHSGVDEGTVKSMDRYHREERHMENGLAYHFVIGNGRGMRDGEIGVGRRWRQQLDGGHLHSAEQNTYSIGICLVGNFDRHKPTPRQMQSLTALIAALLDRCKLSAQAVKTHQQINVVKTRCPGRYFPTRALLQSLKATE